MAILGEIGSLGVWEGDLAAWLEEGELKVLQHL